DDPLARGRSPHLYGIIPAATVPWSAARQGSSLLETAGTFTPIPTSQHSNPAFRAVGVGAAPTSGPTSRAPPPVGVPSSSLTPLPSPAALRSSAPVVLPPRREDFDYSGGACVVG
ncbi:hypothetical protein NQZ68_040670, partial [Dissostichus eleginoides]